jgi:hypothetical protein
MLHTFCNDRLETVTSDAVYNPQITMATALTAKTNILHGDCLAVLPTIVMAAGEHLA